MPDGSPPGEACHQNLREGDGTGQHDLFWNPVVFINQQMMFLWTLNLCFSQASLGRAPGKVTQLHRWTYTPLSQVRGPGVSFTTRVCSLGNEAYTRRPHAAATENHRGTGGGFREADPSEPFKLLAGWQ